MSQIKIDNARVFACKCVEAALERGYSTAVKDIENAYIAGFNEAEERHEKEIEVFKHIAARSFYWSCNFCDGDGGCRRNGKVCELQCNNGQCFRARINES